MGPPILVWTAPNTSSGSRRGVFTSHDRIALTCWLQRADSHGYRRTLLEDGATEGGAENGAFVLVYPPGVDWARWGLARCNNCITVWDCGTGADLGCYDTMFAALSSLPPARHIAAADHLGTRPGRARSMPVNSA